jgi:hypothetical protein
MLRDRRQLTSRSAHRWSIAPGSPILTPRITNPQGARAMLPRICCSRWSLLPLLLPVLSSIAQASADQPTDREALANERFPVNSRRIEAQWGVDCDAALTAVRAVAETTATAAGRSTQQLQGLTETLRLCGFIYNTPDSRIYRPCPAYSQWARWLQQQIGLPDDCQ